MPRFIQQSLITIFIVLLLIVTGCIVFDYSENIVATIKVVSSLALILSMIIALNLYISTTSRHAYEDKRNVSQKFLNESKKLLQKIYETFSDNQPEKLPKNDRYLWLTVARMILSYTKIKAKITDQYDKEIIQEHEEYWKFRLYNIFHQHTEQLPKNYFECTNGEENLEIRSILVIFDFIKWKDGIKDPIDEVNAADMFDQRPIPLDQFNAERYVEKLIQQNV